ncbi:chemotaxis protein CheX [Jeotgalibacillus haloalkalitolerans]|uniref:Chemotaxis protein CheX n=1 Tax=Jeotgalibacillus haloalkalitolerans TaxID=3104292 RepID=A0ABU5KL31_9BACL|nr:chemotaxis protein CheX [Jeotgalibacillus sp. HH7-29]MDZ5711966.1 chemotaxis protein CheX [Jeotgalibacillus sp. HH7-29]
MSTSKVVKNLLNGMIHSINKVVPVTIKHSNPSVLNMPYQQNQVAVLIGMTGELKGNILIDGDKKHFSSLGESMYGMHLEDDMLISFIGEVGNMIAGNLTTYISSEGVEMDITPPSVMSGSSTLHNFKQAVHLPFEAAGIGQFSILVSIQK